MKKEDYPLLMTAKHVSEILGVSMRVAYSTMDQKDFPLILLRRSKYVNRDDFFNWLEQLKKKAM